MYHMFYHSKFNGDISNWDVSNVIDMESMFEYSKFNRCISNWDVSNVKNMAHMFHKSEFCQDISNWDVKKVASYDLCLMFLDCPIKDEYKPIIKRNPVKRKEKKTLSEAFNFDSINK